MSKRIMITISDEMDAKLEEERKRTGAAVSEIIRRAIADRYKDIDQNSIQRGGYRQRREQAKGE